MGTPPTFSITATASQNQQLWIRKVQLTLSNAAGNTLDLSDLRVRLRVQSATINTSKNAEVIVYNLSPNTAQTIFNQKEYTQLSLSAGYKNGPCGQIIKGKIVYMRLGREDAITSYLAIIATDSDDARNWGTINAYFSQGATAEDQLVAILAALAPYGITAGYIPTLPRGGLARGKCLYGKIPDVLNTFASSLHRVWNFQDGLLNIFPTNNPPPVTGDVFILTPQTGMVGVPEQTLDGLNVRSLLTSSIKVGSLVQIPLQYITQVAYTGLQPNRTIPIQPSLSANGLYRVYALTHSGDTRGNDWYSDLICVSTDANAQLPVSNTFLNALPPSS